MYLLSNWRVLSGALMLAMLCGCESLGEHEPPPRNFDELIPRLMGAIQNKTPEQAAVALFDVTSPDERRDALAYLETKPYGHEPAYMKAYELLTTDPHPMVRAQAMRALGSSHQAAEVPRLLKGLDDADVQVRRDAAVGLITTFSEDAIPSLATHEREDPDEQVRLHCAMALHNARTPESIRALIDAVSDRDAAVSYWAHDSLCRVTPVDFYFDSRAWLAWYQKTYSQQSPATSPTSPAAGGGGGGAG